MTTRSEETTPADRDLEDAAVVLMLLAARCEAPAPARPAPALWGDPAHRLTVVRPGTRTWWSSGLPR